MPNIERVWVADAGRFREKERETLRQGAPGAVFDFGPYLGDEMPTDFDVIIGHPPAGLLRRSTRLRLLQLTSAGTGWYPAEVAALPHPPALTNATGAYGPAIAEHMLGMLLMLMKKLHLYRDHMHAGLWQDAGPVPSLDGAEVLAVGMGDIGSCFGRLCAACGAKVTGVRRTPGPCPEYAKAVYTSDQLDRLLPAADVVALSLPETKDTQSLFSRERLGLMKPTAILLNVGRGTAVDTEALCDALSSGALAGAGLDVTDPEPLPKGHRLWSLPQALVTPHASGGDHLYQTVERIAAIAAGNLRRLENGEALQNIVDLTTGYRRRD